MINQKKWLAPIKPENWFLLRTPLLPFDDWISWTDNVDGVAQRPVPLSAIESDCPQRSKTISERFALRFTPQIREALYLSSPSFYASLEEWRSNPDSKKARTIESKLVTFFARLAGRPTPFGLSAGFTMGKTANSTTLLLPSLADSHRHTRLDLRFIFRLARRLDNDQAIKKTAIYRTNPTLSSTGGKLRYLEINASSEEGTWIACRLITCESTPELTLALELANRGASLDQLTSALAVSEENAVTAAEFVEELIDSQILLSDVAPTISGPDPTSQIIQTASRAPSLRNFAERLSAVQGSLSELDSQGLGVNLQLYHSIEAQAQLLSGSSKNDKEMLFHVDLEKPSFNVTLGPNVLASLTRGLQALHRISRPRDSVLLRFAEAFTRRYGSREVPLLEVTDDDSGITSTLHVERTRRAFDATIHRTERNDLPYLEARDFKMLQLVGPSLSAPGTELSLSEKDLTVVENASASGLLASFAVMMTIIASSVSDVNKGNFKLLIQAYGSAASMLGRFSALNADIHRELSKMLRREETHLTDAIFADIVHYPVGELLGNVVVRPVLSEFEIPLFSRSTLPSGRQVTPADLLVSVVDGQTILRSLSLNKRVIPRLSNAHAFTREGNIAVYKLLGMLAMQGCIDSPVWEWGPILEGLPYLPRVRFKDCIFARARWRLWREEISELLAASEPLLIDRIRSWRRARNVPRFVFAIEFDRQLPIDLENFHSAKSWLRSVRALDSVVLAEMLPGPDEMCVEGPEGHFNHEIIIPFTSSGPQTITRTFEGIRQETRKVENRLSDTRVFGPGSEWLYIKLYSSPLLLEEFLLTGVAELIGRLEEKGLIDRWFFIRYEDPNHHLRIRLHRRSDEFNKEILNEIHGSFQKVLASGQIYQLQFDTYDREVERYGGWKGIDLAERVFAADSRAVLAVLCAINTRDVEARLEFALCAAHALLADCGFALETRLDFVQTLRRSMDHNLQISRVERHVLGDEFRKRRHHIVEVLKKFPANVSQILTNRSRTIHSIIEEDSDSNRNLQLIVCCLPSFLHMHVNRLFRDRHRHYELLVQDMLFRAYDSMRAISKTKGESE